MCLLCGHFKNLLTFVLFLCKQNINKYKNKKSGYNLFLVYCRELAPGTVSLTGDWAQGDDSKHDSHYTYCMCFPQLLQSCLYIGSHFIQAPLPTSVVC